MTADFDAPGSNPVPEATAQAAAAAESAATRAEVEIRSIRHAAQAHEAADLFSSVWRTGPAGAPVSAHLMQAMAHTGNYVVGVYSGGDLVGASLAWRAGDPTELHSHISGFTPPAQNRGAGFALKLHQRAWALRRGLTTVTWTVDPLVRRNMRFNLAKLRAEVVAYLPNFYGAMGDGVNGADQSDRLMLSWRLLSPDVVAASSGQRAPEVATGSASGYLLRVGTDESPVVESSRATIRRCQVPADIVALRATSPALADRWRRDLRNTLGRALDAGSRVISFTSDGDYVLVAGERNSG
jgi:predicted GNAT superfamily acetyltransferase